MNSWKGQAPVMITPGSWQAVKNTLWEVWWAIANGANRDPAPLPEATLIGDSKEWHLRRHLTKVGTRFY